MNEISELDAKALNTFPGWLKTLSDDARAMAKLVCDPSCPVAARAALAAGLNYLIKSVDLIADGIEDLGYLDDAFVLRVAAQNAQRAERDLASVPDCARLAEEVSLVVEFLGDDHQRLEAFVAGLTSQVVRGRAAEAIADDAELAAALQQDIHAWADSYVNPGFSRDEKNLVKLRAFMNAKLREAG